MFPFLAVMAVAFSPHRRTSPHLQYKRTPARNASIREGHVATIAVDGWQAPVGFHGDGGTRSADTNSHRRTVIYNHHLALVKNAPRMGLWRRGRLMNMDAPAFFYFHFVLSTYHVSRRAARSLRWNQPTGEGRGRDGLGTATPVTPFSAQTNAGTLACVVRVASVFVFRLFSRTFPRHLSSRQ